MSAGIPCCKYLHGTEQAHAGSCCLSGINDIVNKDDIITCFLVLKNGLFPVF